MDFKALTEIAKSAHENAVEHGFYTAIRNTQDYLLVNDQPRLSENVERDFILSQISKICGECGEAVSAIQHEELFSQHLGEELADVLIRTFDLMVFCDYDVGACVESKMRHNVDRPYLHGKNC